MSYDYSSESKTFELPNPYRFQNLIFLLCGACLVVAGLYSLVDVRTAINIGQGGRAVAPLLLSLVLLGQGLYLITKALRRLRFYFGRGKPVSLAPELAAQTHGSSKPADILKETLRQRTLAYYEPQGALQGFLYHQFPKLITAPQEVQRQAQQHFVNLSAVLITLLSFLIAWGLLGDSTTRPWVGLVYFIFGAFWVLKPVVAHTRSQMGMAQLVGLIVAGILAPVLVRLVASKLPNLGELNFHLQTFILLIGALMAIGCVFMAAISQITSMPSTGVSNELSRQSMQSPPSSVFDELARKLQSQWTENIPNRKYSYNEPLTPLSQAGGAFNGELLEETQPMPITGRQAQSLGQLLADKSRQFLVITDIFGAVFMLTAVILAMLFIRQFDILTAFSSQPWYLLSCSFVLACVANFCFHSSATLWGRFDFQSELIWVQTQGTYQVSSVGTGNQLTSQMQTRNDIVRIEGMTLNIWCTNIESVVFGQGQGHEERQIIAMNSSDKACRELHTHLQKFIAEQSVLSAPQSSADASKLRQLMGSEQLLKTAGNVAASVLDVFKGDTSLENSLASSQPTVEVPQSIYCTGCGVALPEHAKFCSACGQAKA